MNISGGTMFGHQDEPKQNDSNDQPAVAPSDDNANPALPPATVNFGAPAAAATQPSQIGEFADVGGTLETPTSGNSAAFNYPDPASDTNSAQDDTRNTDTAIGTPGPLSDLKQKALQQLSPLVGQLEQTPEEKFRTTMMMIQAADNQDLLQSAYDAASQITDEKAKAQALLDVINEINYFSQK